MMITYKQVSNFVVPYSMTLIYIYYRSDYVGLPGYSGMSPRSSRPPAMPDFDEHSSTGSPLSLGSRSTSPCRTEDDASQVRNQ